MCTFMLNRKLTFHGFISYQHIKNDKHYLQWLSCFFITNLQQNFECIIYNPVFLYLENNELLTPQQFGFHPNDSCIYQLISIVHNIHVDFDHHPLLEVRGIFLDLKSVC